jgi:membrane associated rhomboid family serine protease
MQPTPPAGGHQTSPQFPGCYRHPDRPTGVRCIRCDRPICPECQIPGAVGFQCPDDVAAGAASTRVPRTMFGAPASRGPGGEAWPWVSYGLISVNVLVFLITAFSPGGDLLDDTGTKLFNQWDLWPNAIGVSHEYYRLLTSAFLHLGLVHIALNMYALYVLGPGLERAMGRWRFSAVYLLSALGGSVFVLCFGSPNSAVAGASTAIFGLFAAAWLLMRVTGASTRPLTVVIVINVVFTLSVPGISKLGHLGGFAIGGVATLALLGWQVRASTGRIVGAGQQLAGLAAILLVLVVAAVIRAESLNSGTAVSLGRTVSTTAPLGSTSSYPQVHPPLGRTTPL